MKIKTLIVVLTSIVLQDSYAMAGGAMQHQQPFAFYLSPDTINTTNRDLQITDGQQVLAQLPAGQRLDRVVPIPFDVIQQLDERITLFTALVRIVDPAVVAGLDPNEAGQADMGLITMAASRSPTENAAVWNHKLSVIKNLRQGGNRLVPSRRIIVGPHPIHEGRMPHDPYYFTIIIHENEDRENDFSATTVEIDRAFAA